MHIVGWISIDNFLFNVELVLLTLRIVQILQPFQKLQTASNVFFFSMASFDLICALGWVGIYVSFQQWKDCLLLLDQHLTKSITRMLAPYIKKIAKSNETSQNWSFFYSFSRKLRKNCFFWHTESVSHFFSHEWPIVSLINLYLKLLDLWWWWISERKLFSLAWFVWELPPSLSPVWIVICVKFSNVVQFVLVWIYLR